jgi:hypothetical protein
MKLKLEDFYKIETAKYGVDQRFWEGDYILEYDSGKVKIPLELTLTEYAGDPEHDKYFSIDIHQGKTHYGDEFETLEEALQDLQFRIDDFYQGDILMSNEEIRWSMVGDNDV